MKKVIVGLALYAFAMAAHAISVNLVSHKVTANGTTISTYFFDGSATQSSGIATTATWDWDGTVLTATGQFNEVTSLGSVSMGATVIEDQSVGLILNTSTSTGTATSYTCLEGTFLSTVGASGCGGYSFNDGVNDSTTTWGPGLATAQTIGGDDTSTTDGVRGISNAYDGYDLISWDGVTLVLGSTIPLGTGGANQLVFSAVPVPAAVWLFGSALGLLGWARRRSA